MIRPLTCLSLVAALGAGLYLYQEKHRAQLLDRDITRTVKQAEQARDRIGLLKAEWALLNEPERLQGLAAQHLQLQPLQPAQFVRLEDLRSRLPAVSVLPAVVDPPPMAAVAPAQPVRTQLAAATPVASAPAPAASRPAAAAPAKPDPASQLAAVLAARPTPLHLQLAAAKPREPEPVPRPAAPERRTLFAPVMPAYAPTPVVVHAPTVQTASAVAPQSVPFVGSALGMGRTTLAAPVPVSSATMLGYASGQ